MTTVVIPCLAALRLLGARRKAQDARSGVTRHLSTPDLDNLSKAILDACNEVVFHDDRQVVYLAATKCYAESPRVTVRFEEWRK